MLFKKFKKIFLWPINKLQYRRDLKRAIKRLKEQEEYLNFLKGREIDELLEDIKAKGRTIAQQRALLQQEKELPADLFTCTICWSGYSTLRVPVIGVCGHTICRKCVDAMPTDNCPICRETASFFMDSKNFLAYAFLEHLNRLPEEEEEESVESRAARNIEREEEDNLYGIYVEDDEYEEQPEWDDPGSEEDEDEMPDLVDAEEDDLVNYLERLAGLWAAG